MADEDAFLAHLKPWFGCALDQQGHGRSYEGRNQNLVY